MESMDFKEYVQRLDARFQLLLERSRSVVAMQWESDTTVVWRSGERFVYAQRTGNTQVSFALFPADSDFARDRFFDDLEAPNLDETAQKIDEFLGESTDE